MRPPLVEARLSTERNSRYPLGTAPQAPSLPPWSGGAAGPNAWRSGGEQPQAGGSLNPRGLGGTGRRPGMVIIQGVREGTPPWTQSYSAFCFQGTATPSGSYMQLSSAVSRPVTLVFFALRCMTVARKRIFSHFSRFFHVLPIFPRRSCLAASRPPPAPMGNAGGVPAGKEGQAGGGARA